MKANLPDHLAYQSQMEERGILVLAGPCRTHRRRNAGQGMIVYRAASMNEAHAIAEADPMHQAGARSFNLRKWLVNEGSLTINVGLSTGRAELS